MRQFNNLVLKYTDHIDTSVEKSNKAISHIAPEVLSILGMSQYKNRHLMNNLASFKGCNYLEVGLYKGSTFISALSNNLENISSAIGIDDWSEFQDHAIEDETGTPISVKEQFVDNLNKIIGPNEKVKWFDANAFQFEKGELNNINLFFYDGPHSLEEHRRIYHYFDNVLSDIFIAVIDDWGDESGNPKKGTLQAFFELKYNILKLVELPSGNPDGYHGGVGIALIQK